MRRAQLVAQLLQIIISTMEEGLLGTAPALAGGWGGSGEKGTQQCGRKAAATSEVTTLARPGLARRRG